MVAEREIRENGLRDVVEPARGEHTPVQVAGLQRDTVGARVCGTLLRPVPGVDRQAIIGAHVARVGFDNGGVEEAADCGTAVEIDGD